MQPGRKRGRRTESSSFDAADLAARIAECRLCPRLVEHRERIGRVKRRAFRDQAYWARAVPSFGDPDARLFIVGLAPAAHGANRTGRMFTGDSSGAWLYRALFETGFANQGEAVSADDGLVLTGTYVTAAAHCAPPDNKPSREEIERCRPYLLEETEGLLSTASPSRPLIVLALGALAYRAALDSLRTCRVPVPRPLPRFAHGLEVRLSPVCTLLASYHPSRQNTQTGKLSRTMFASVFQRARVLTGRRTRAAQEDLQ